MMRVLCVCQKGNSRSVGMAWYLRNQHQPAHDAIAIGMKTANRQTKKMLYRWADLIILLAPQYRRRIPERWDSKVVVCDVGHDTYFRDIHSDLLEQCRAFAASCSKLMENVT